MERQSGKRRNGQDRKGARGGAFPPAAAKDSPAGQQGGFAPGLAQQVVNQNAFLSFHGSFLRARTSAI
jgi:hypothetical protein